MLLWDVFALATNDSEQQQQQQQQQPVVVLVVPRDAMKQ
jgi:hypothetical protein